VERVVGARLCGHVKLTVPGPTYTDLV
jgi:hypothetical protein